MGWRFGSLGQDIARSRYILDLLRRSTTLLSDGDFSRQCVNQLAGELGVTVNQLVLAYIMHTDPGIIPVFGASSPEQLYDSLGALNITWTEELAATMRNAGA
jgi:aryl-alcohol dehydrogenase-like predicted oxidoreductase